MRSPWLIHYESAVQLALFRMGFHNLRASVSGGIVSISAIAWLTHASVPAERWQLWLGIECVSMTLGVLVWATFRRWATPGQTPDLATLRRWMWAHFGLISFDGIGAGSVGLLFVTGHTTQNLLIATAFVGAGAFSAVGNAAHNLPAFIATVLIAAGLMSQHFPVAFGADTPIVLLLCWLYAAMLGWTAIQAHATLVDTIRLRLDHERLAGEHAQAAALARQASLDKSEFLAAASHDLRQPVHALVLLVEALRQRRAHAGSRAEPVPPAEHEQDQLIASIGDSAQAISHLFGGLMELSRLESGREQPLPTPLQPAALLHRVLARHAPVAQQRGLALRWHVSPEAEAAWVHTDAVMLERCLVNLLANALRYTERGGVLLSLRTRPDGALYLAVHDTGPGIDPLDQARIFEPYVQLGNAERDRRRGLGLGLAIVRQCADRLGLTLQLRSHPGRGSAFTLRLPAVLRCPPPLIARPPSSPPDIDQLVQVLRSRRVLLIDDDTMVRDAMRSLLQSWQVDLRLAHHGQDPMLTQLTEANWQPDAVLCDYRLPGEQQGLALLGALQDRWPTTPAVLLTGEPPERVQALAEEAGFPVLYKPVSPALLASTLCALMPARSPPTHPPTPTSAAPVITP